MHFQRRKKAQLKLNKLITHPLFLKLLTFILLLVGWEFLARSGLYRPHLFPPPSNVLPTLYDMSVSGELWQNFKSSSLRWGAGYLLGLALGIFWGFFTGRQAWCKHSFGSLFNALSSIPKIVLIPLTILWFGMGEWQKILLVSWGSFFPIWLNTQVGCEEIESEYLWTAKSLGFNKTKLFCHVIFPAALPHIITGMRIGISTAIFSLAAAEMSGAFSGLVHQIFYSHEMFQTDRMMAGVVFITLLSFFINEIFILATHYLIPWNKNTQADAYEE
jgi:ABC-type nitrate/sulfonate/bicarbonate transport system permease component